MQLMHEAIQIVGTLLQAKLPETELADALQRGAEFSLVVRAGGAVVAAVVAEPVGREGRLESSAGLQQSMPHSLSSTEYGSDGTYSRLSTASFMGSGSSSKLEESPSHGELNSSFCFPWSQ